MLVCVCVFVLRCGVLVRFISCCFATFSYERGCAVLYVLCVFQFVLVCYAVMCDVMFDVGVLMCVDCLCVFACLVVCVRMWLRVRVFVC